MNPAEAVDPSTFDHHSAEFGRDPYGCFAALRAHGDLVRSEQHGGFYAAVGYETMIKAMKDGARFASEHVISDEPTIYQGLQIPPSPNRTGFIELDGPVHQHFRRLLNPWFSPAAMEQWTEVIGDLALDAVARIHAAGRCDVVHDLGSPVPARITMDLLALPRELGDDFAAAFHAQIGTTIGSPERAAAQEAYGHMMGELSGYIAERYADPSGDDLMSFLCRATFPDGTRLALEDVAEQVGLVLAGGFDTTTSLIVNSMLWLAEHPEHVKQLREDPATWDLATEEFLRYTSPVLALARSVTEACTLDSTSLVEGDRVLLCFGAANHDPAEFDQPDDVVLDRFPNRHVTFGVGPHRCIGSNLARAVFRTVMPTILENCLDFHIDREAAVRYPSVSVGNGWLSMPMTFTPSDELRRPTY
jgi:cytochrome P450